MRAWEEFLQTQEKALGKEVVDVWLKPLKVVSFDACNLYLEAQDSFKALWFEEHIREKAQQFLLNNNNKKIKVHLSIASSIPVEKKKKEKPLFVPQHTFKLTFDQLEEGSQFESFVQGKNNLLAYKVLAEIAGVEAPEELSFNPIYLFGREGCGKTHLMMATCHALRKKGKNALYVRAETFTEHVVAAIRSGEMQAFRKSYRTRDALLIDNIDIFGKKSATQEEFFHTFNALHVERKAIILASSLSPQELKEIEPRLISRFEWGLVIPVGKLEKEKQRELLERRLQGLHFQIDEEVIFFLLETFSSNTDALLRSVDALILRAHLSHVTLSSHSSLSLEMCQKMLSDLIEEEERSHLNPSKILSTVAEHYSIKVEDILGKSQSKECTLPRQIAMHLIRSELNLSFVKIGSLFSRDHSTVISSIKLIQKALDEKNQEITQHLNGISKKLS